MTWVMTLEIIGATGGLTALIALFLAPMLYLGSKIDSFREQVQQETKDFHGRLCTLEQKNTQMMERFLEEKNKK